jgi:hypothetical protein
MAGASHDFDSQAILEWARRMKLSRFREEPENFLAQPFVLSI